MIDINIYESQTCKIVSFGRKGENLARRIMFDLSALIAEFGAGSFEWVIRRPNESTVYIAVNKEQDGNTAILNLTTTETAISGYGGLELRYYVDDVIVKTIVWRTSVAVSLGGGDVPDPIEDYIDQMHEIAQEASESADAAGDSATQAAVSAANAANSATEAAGYAANAAASAGAAADSATDSAASATAAHTSEVNAANSATAAAGSETNAASSAANAAVSSTNAASSATQAAGSASEASTSAAQAAASATAADQSAQDIAAAATQIETNKDDITDLKNQITQGATPIVNTASGAIASFSDGADDVPVKDLKVSVEPVQDLHGYENPWPEGGGKNKANITTETIEKPAWYPGAWEGVSVNSKGGITQTRGFQQSGAGGFTVVLSEGTYTFSMTYDGASTACYLHVATWDGTSRTTLLNNVVLDKKENMYYTTFSIPAGSVEVSIRPAISSATEAYDLNYIQIEAGSTATSWIPYSNICPITGWTGMNLRSTGKNLFEASAFVVDASKRRCGATASDDVITITCIEAGQVWIGAVGNQVGSGLTNNFTIRVNGEETIAVSTKNGSSVASYMIVEADASKKVLRTQSSYNGIFTVGSNTRYVALRITVSNNMEVGDTWVDAVQVEYGSTATSYEPYSGQTYTVNWETEAGTVYGGQLDVTTGVLTVDKVLMNKLWGEGYGATDLGSCVRKAFGVSNAVTGADKSMCNCAGYEYSFGADHPHYWINNATQIYIVLPEETDASFVIQVVYTLANPQTYQLTPTEVKTLLKQNNIFADTGDIASVEYVADTKTYIDAKTSAAQKLMELIITANREDSMTATANYSIGDLIIVAGTLYKATAAIASGATMTEGTNVAQTTIAAELAALA